MTNDAYRAALKQAESDLSKAVAERDKWTLEVARLEQLVNSLAGNISRDPRGMLSRYVQETGIQDVILTAVRQFGKPVRATDVRDHFKFIGYDISKFSNPLAVIHGALKRLAKAGKIDEIENGVYKCKPIPFYGEY